MPMIPAPAATVQTGGTGVMKRTTGRAETENTGDRRDPAAVETSSVENPMKETGAITGGLVPGSIAPAIPAAAIEIRKDLPAPGKSIEVGHMTETGTSSGHCNPQITFGAIPMTPTDPNPASGAGRSSDGAARPTETVRDGTVARGGPAGRRGRIPEPKGIGTTAIGIPDTKSDGTTMIRNADIRSAGTITARILDTASYGRMPTRPARPITPLATADTPDTLTGVISAPPA